MRKGFKFISKQERETPVFNQISQTVPDQTISLRELLLQFSYISDEKVSEIVNKGYIGDEDEDVLGVDASCLDFTEIHDRLIDRMNKDSLVRVPEPKSEPSLEPVEEPVEDAEGKAL